MSIHDMYIMSNVMLTSFSFKSNSCLLMTNNGIDRRQLILFVSLFIVHIMRMWGGGGVFASNQKKCISKVIASSNDKCALFEHEIQLKKHEIIDFGRKQSINRRKLLMSCSLHNNFLIAWISSLHAGQQRQQQNKSP